MNTFNDLHAFVVGALRMRSADSPERGATPWDIFKQLGLTEKDPEEAIEALLATGVVKAEDGRIFLS